MRLQRVDDIKYDELNELGSTKIIPLGYALDGIYGTSSTSFSTIPIEVMLPELADIDNYSSIEAKLVIDYETEGSATMETRLFNYTDFVAISGTVTAHPNQTWGHGSSDWFNLTAEQGKSIRIQSRRVGGGVLDDVKIEGAVLLLRLKK